MPNPKGPKPSDTMRSPFNSKILRLLAGSGENEGEKLEAPEDSSILYYATARAARRLREEDKDAKIGLVDICSGTGVVPVHLLERGSVDEFTGLDIYIESAMDFREELIKRFSHTDWQHSAHFREFNINKESAAPIIEEVRARVDRLIVSSNPPWVPIPKSLEISEKAAHFCTKHDLDFRKLAAFMGGENGLKHYPKIFEITQGSGADRVCLNVSSAGDMRELIRLILDHSFELEFIEAVETMTYGFDGTPKLQQHLREGVPNNYCRESEKGLRYLVMGLLLRKAGSDNSAKESMKSFKSFLEAFKRGDIGPADSSPFYRLRGLTKKDQDRMKIRKRRRRRRRK